MYLTCLLQHRPCSASTVPIIAHITACVIGFGPSSLSFKQNALQFSQRCPTSICHTVGLLQTNILVGNSGSAVLADFGLAQDVNNGQEDSAYRSVYK